ncbi:ApbA-domain-containing protein [Hyphopichia burtonii NRRL Y-1933]|uniref:ApbA-domain-containing protein n=1 Tax=Hyphopichia burtonii NRRL Y-1933 TaxID=984485 RepID=A0A1E4RCR8_9ASCO|nr:ApbA-domain-containing protein [Hyphopichia burtonii NRRL Y-1933]ODV65047.1 ApbA-domain-containing protein [Hyphopichia burtonii NRRL Y-1933]
MSKPNVLVIGAGGVGVIAALALQLNGNSNVTLVVRSEHELIKNQGYSIESKCYGEYENFKPDNIAKSVDEAMDNYGPFDFIALTTKNIPDGSMTCEDIVRPAVTDGKTTIILIQNGIGIDEPMIESFPNNVILSGVSLIGSTNLGNGRVYNSHFDTLTIGYFNNPNISNSVSMSKVNEFISLYQNKDLSKNLAKLDENVKHTRWQKLIYNSALNTVTTIVDLDVNRCQINNSNKSLFEPAMSEIIKIAKSEGVTLDESVKSKFMHIGDGLFYTPSMLIDRRKKQLFELEVILGNPIKYADRNGVDAPTLKILYSLLTMIQFKIKEEIGLVKINESDFKNIDSNDYPSHFAKISHK